MEVRISFADPAGPVAGTVFAPDGSAAGFHGWLELMDALEQSRGGTGVPPASGGALAQRSGELAPRADA